MQINHETADDLTRLSGQRKTRYLEHYAGQQGVKTMKTIELTRTNGTVAQVTFDYKDGDALNSPTLLSVKTAEVEIKKAALMTKSDIKLYADALKECTAVIGGRVENEPGLIACIRLDEINYAKLQKEMKNEYDMEEADSEAKTAAR
jgi:hypothetical protein